MTFSSHRVKCDCLTFTNFSWAKRTNWIKTADYICTFHKQLDSRTSVIEKCQTWNMILFSEMILLRFLAMIGMISLQTKKLICDCGSQIKPKKRNSETAFSAIVQARESYCLSCWNDRNKIIQFISELFRSLKHIPI